MIASDDVTQELPAVVLAALPRRTARTRPLLPQERADAPTSPRTPWRTTRALSELWRRADAGQRIPARALNQTLRSLARVHRRLGVLVVEP